MKNYSFTAQTTFRILYYNNKEYVIPVIVITVCILIFLQFIIPQVQQVFWNFSQVNVIQQKVQSIEKNISIASSLDDSQLNQSLQTTFTALPQEKNFSSIIDAVNKAAAISNVFLGDYTVQVGDLGAAAENKNSPKNLQFVLTINGNIYDIQRFLTALKSNMPLSSATDVKVDQSNNAQITVIFYYKPLSAISFTSSTPLQPITDSQNKLLNQIASSNTLSVPNSSR